MISIFEASVSDFSTIQQIAYQTWPETYGTILSAAQLNYMLEEFYSEETLLKNLIEKKHHFLIFKEEEMALGFISFQHQYQDQQITRIHKIYILPNNQGKGIGKKLLKAAIRLANENKSERLSLNVNRFNNAQHFYLKCGFTIVKEENLDIGNNYFMEDYVMEKLL